MAPIDLYFLIDGNNFYVSAERIYDLSLRGRPVAVLSNGDSTIVALSSEAKRLGLKKFSFFSDALTLPRAKDCVFLSSNYELYNSVSNALHSVIAEFSPVSYQYSIDESWLKCRMHPNEAIEYANYIRREIWRRTRVAVSIGIGQTLTLSKAGSKLAKTNQTGTYYARPSSNELSELNVADVWGIGSKRAKQCTYMGITTALQLAEISPDTVQRTFNIDVRRTVLELNGVPAFSWGDQMPDRQQIVTSRTLSIRPNNLTDLQQIFSEIVDIAAGKARQQNSRAKSLSIFMSTTLNSPEYYTKRTMHTLEFASNDIRELSKVVKQLVEKTYIEASEISKVGVCLLKLQPASKEQLDLFTPSTAVNDTLMACYDAINKKYGKNSLFVASSGVDTKSNVKRDRLTPKYRTDWAQIPILLSF